MNLDPTIWGPHAWFFLESVVIGMPEHPSDEEKAAYKDLFYSLQYLLPCEKCRIHFASNINESPLTDDVLSSKQRTIEWIVDFHNRVRVQQNKDPRSTAEFLSYYKAKYNYDGNKDINFALINALIVCMVLAYGFYYYNIKKN